MRTTILNVLFWLNRIVNNLYLQQLHLFTFILGALEMSDNQDKKKRRNNGLNFCDNIGCTEGFKCGMCN